MSQLEAISQGQLIMKKKKKKEEKLCMSEDDNKTTQMTGHDYTHSRK
jgi:hypothetical protein